MLGAQEKVLRICCTGTLPWDGSAGVTSSRSRVCVALVRLCALARCDVIGLCVWSIPKSPVLHILLLSFLRSRSTLLKFQGFSRVSRVRSGQGIPKYWGSTSARVRRCSKSQGSGRIGSASLYTSRVGSDRAIKF